MVINHIDWNSPRNEVLCNPRIPSHEKVLLHQALSALGPSASGKMVFGTSGSTGALKWVVLTKKAVLACARAANLHLNSDSSDRWLNPLPSFHVGGMGILARAHLSGAQVFFYENKWNAETFLNQLYVSKATLTALVPAQVFDLVSANYSPPPSLRAVIVGGGVLNEKIYFEAVAKGWPLLPSYGLTECASQVATAETESWKKGEYPLLKPLEHVKLDLDDNGRLKIKSSALFEGYLYVNNEKSSLVDPKENGWFTTEDHALLQNGSLVGVKRKDSFIKIGGESVDMARLEKIFEEVKLNLNFPFDATLIALPDERLENTIHLVVAEYPSQILVDRLLESLHSCVFPFERVRKVHKLIEIPRSPLKKVQKNELLKMIKDAHAIL